MIRVGDHLLPYDPTPVIEKYKPIFEHLAQEVDQLREVWHHLAPVWHPRLDELLEEEGLSIWVGVVSEDGYGVVMRREQAQFVVNGRLYRSDYILKLLTHEVRLPDELDRVIARLQSVIQRFWRAIARMKEEALEHTRQEADHRSLLV
ncbi:MAG: hypothetical protein DIU62_004920 [Pseudomonadota bacterium]